MQRLPVISLILLAPILGCGNSAEPGSGAVRGVGFEAPISDEALRQLRGLGTVLSVSYSARVVMLQTQAPVARLGAVTGTPSIGPDLGSPDSLQLESAMEFPGAPTQADLSALAAVGTITYVFPEYHSAFLQVPVRDIGRLDNVPNVVSAYVNYDPVRPQ